MWWHHVDVDAAPTGVFGGCRGQSLNGLCRCRAVCRVLLERCSEGTRFLIGEILIELRLCYLRLGHLLLLSQELKLLQLLTQVALLSVLYLLGLNLNGLEVLIGQSDGPTGYASPEHALPHCLPAHLVNTHALFEVERDILHVGGEDTHLLDGVGGLLIARGVDAAAVTPDHEVWSL